MLDRERGSQLVLPEVPAELGLQLVDPKREKVNQLVDEIAQLAHLLGTRPGQLVLPERGVLAVPLNASQKVGLNECLAPIYAAYFVAMQDTVRTVPINESGEKMVDATQAYTKAGVQATFSSAPINPNALEGWAGQPRVWWGRESVVAKCVRAGQALNRMGYQQHFEDMFRPVGVQEGLFQFYNARIRELHPDWDGDLVFTEVRSKIAYAAFIAGHKGGAAADIVLRTLSGQFLDLGNTYIEPSVAVVMDYPHITWDQYRTRQLFGHAHKMVGLSVYPGEDWHVSADDTIAAMVSLNPQSFVTRFAPIREFDRQTGEIIPHDPVDYYTPFNTASR